MKTYDDIGTWLNDITFDCSEEGDYKYEVTLEDYSHNITGDTFYVHVAEDYAKHVSGFHDWVVEQNADIDFTKGIETDERIASVTPGEIDLSQTGEYTLTYSITGDDNSTVIEHPVTVTVIDASTAQAKANSGESVYVSGNALKEKEVQKVASTSSNSSANKSTNSSSATSSTSGEQSGTTTSGTSNTNDVCSDSYSSDTPHFYDSWEPGTTIDIGEPIGSSEIREGGTAYAFDSFDLP